MVNCTAILLMAGSGARFGTELPKQYQMLGGKRVYQHALARLAKSSLFSQIIVVVAEPFIELVKSESPGHAIIVGGATRYESSYSALKACHEATEYVLIHDAARPFVSEEILRANIARVVEASAVTTCIPATDTIIAVRDGFITSMPDRATLFCVQTPQTFRYDWIMKAYAQRTDFSAVTDDCRLLFESGKEVAITPGSAENFKITTKQDLAFAETLLR